LEASSSGESGARFAVVAAEIRRFADSVADSTKSIKAQIEEIQNETHLLISESNNQTRRIDFGVEQMSEQKTIFEDIVTNSQNLATKNQQIANLSKQQEYASQQIFDTLKEISAGAQQFVLMVTSANKTVDNLNDMSVLLKVALERYKTK
jgi:methyl-accepting chemotaxis protein